MIIDNYTNTLPENKRSDADFFSIESPTLNVRMFEYNLVRGVTHLVLPYYVGDSEHKDYTEEKTGPTFTTVFAFDEDTLPQDEVQVIKKTTYAGEQIIDFGVFTEEGIHSISLYTVQSNGVSSPTKFLYFIVRKPESEFTVIDLTESTEFSSNVQNYTRYLCPHKNYPQILATVYTRSYEVVCNGPGDVYITVRKPSDEPWHTVYFLSDESGTLGSRVADNPNNVDYDLLDYELMQAASSTSEVTYHLTDKCTVNGSEVLLKDYVGYVGTLPSEVISAGVENKLALMYLFEAAKAVNLNNTVKLILPEMDIVCDYHFANVARSISGLSDIAVNQATLTLPDGIVIDLNKSTIYALPTSNHVKGRMIYGLYNTDTHIINGNIVGNWGNSTLAGGSDGEHRSMLLFEACRFCSIEDLNISYTVGYDATCSSNTQGHNLRTNISFGNLSYIDYNGDIHTSGIENDSSICGYRLSDNAYNVVTPNQLCSPRVFMLYKDSRNPVNPAAQLYGPTDNIQTKTCRTIFVHFYDKDGEFLKTVKALQQWYILIPYGAKTARISAYGTIHTDNAYDTPDVLSGINSAKRFAVFAANVPPCGCCTERCVAHDTRMVVFLTGGIQSKVKDCIMYNIAGERRSDYVNTSAPSKLSPTEDYDSYPIYKLLMDIEETAIFSFHTFYDGISCLYSDNISIKIDGTYDAHYKNCHNVHFSFGHPVVDYVIENCSGSIGRNHSWLSGPSHSVIRNCILKAINNGGYHVSQGNCMGSGKYSGDLYIKNCDVLSKEGVLPIHDEPNIKS